MTTTESGSELAHADPHSHSATELPRWQHGRVDWFNAEKGFGFITSDDGTPVFVEYSAIASPGYKTLTAGQRVVFTTVDAPRGPEAAQVVAYPVAIPPTHVRAGTTIHLPTRTRRRSDSSAHRHSAAA
ncbi:cold-shock protein [Nocardia veterana]|uniref:cold-shock protein n=1 Tax=Nocardia veterana TaxID=132249 RepID=UPI0002E12461